MEKKEVQLDEDHATSRIKWVIGTPYFVQGTSGLTEIPILYFIKFVLGMGDAGGQLFDSLRQTGWFIKPLWGYLSDKVPLFGYHRKSWYVLMACLTVVFWAVNALLALFGITIPIVYLVTFNLAFATYAFVDVVCDALMVTYGRKLGRVGSFINFQWAVLAIGNALSIYLGGWLQGKVEGEVHEFWIVFLLASIPPMATAAVGIRNIEEEPVSHRKNSSSEGKWSFLSISSRAMEGLSRLRALPSAFRDLRENHRPIWLLVLFIFFWKFSPSVGFIERSYLIDVRGFTPESFGIVLSIGGLAFFVSVLFYAWIVNRFPGIQWYQYLYAMVALGTIAFPLSFYLYLDPEHPWWDFLYFTVPDWMNPLPAWSRYQWFYLIVQTVLGFATIPAFIIPLTLAGQTVNVAHAGVGYAFLMSLSNVTTLFEGVVGAMLYDLLSSPTLDRLVTLFERTRLNIAVTANERTLILEMFVYISLLFTLLTIPFIELLRREFARRRIEISLGKHE